MSASPRARFVVGTGRCGSTLLSRMLSENARVLSLFEFFSGIDQFFRFRSDPVAAEELAERLRQDHPMLTMVLERGYEVPEVVYPFGAPGMRYALGDPIPWSLGIALPRLSDAPDALFDEMIRFTTEQPMQPLAHHYRAIFEWLCERLGRDCWIERSGGSIEFVGELRELFPDARFVHIHRDGREAALSMREYPVLRVAVAVMYGLVGEIEYSYEGLTELARSGGEAIDRLLGARPAVELYGRYWSEQIERGLRTLQDLPRDSYLDVRFEDLVSDPATALQRIGAFLELPDAPGWIERGRRLVKGMPPGRFDRLARDEQLRLEAACKAAMERLGR
jgi:putative sulfotransferase